MSGIQQSFDGISTFRRRKQGSAMQGIVFVKASVLDLEIIYHLINTRGQRLAVYLKRTEELTLLLV